MATVKWRRAAMGNNKRSRRLRPLTLTHCAATLVPVSAATVAAAAVTAAALAAARTTTDTATATTTTTKMAALIRHGSLANAFRSTSAVLAVNTATVRYDITRHKSKKPNLKPKVKVRFDSTCESLAARGFLRPQKSYEPPEDSSKRIDSICESHNISTLDDTKLEDPVLRFKILVACEEEFKHPIPNSLLYTIESLADLKQFYSTAVNSTMPYESFSRIELPKNLHIQQQYHRFHPDTDTMFGGVTAFPKSSTLVTGLKYKKKYAGHSQEDPWLNEMMKV